MSCNHKKIQDILQSKRNARANVKDVVGGGTPEVREKAMKQLYNSMPHDRATERKVAKLLEPDDYMLYLAQKQQQKAAPSARKAKPTHRLQAKQQPQQGGPMVIDKLNPTQTRPMFRSPLIIKKNILDFKLKKNQVSTSSNALEPAQESALHQPAAQEPAAQEPAAQEPAAREPAAQEPAAQEPILQEPPHQEQPQQESAQEPAQEPTLAERFDFGCRSGA
jgi:hypothetical protein